jgi:hypothetical protein
MKFLRTALAVVLALSVDAVRAAVFIEVPVVTQVQGVTSYRTSLAISNIGQRAQVYYIFTYRSPVDGTIQNGSLLSVFIETNDAFATDDIIGFLKANGAIRAQDNAAPLFGTLEVQMLGNVAASEISVVARTYSPMPDGGTVGISYLGREYNTTNEAFNRIVTTVRNGSFGRDGNTRANLGFVNVAIQPMDLHITYIDAASHAILKTFDLSAVVGHLLESREVVQLNNIFGGPALAGSSRIIVTATPSVTQSFTGYAVQLDNTTNDGSFFLMTEK